jgi:hypothetical protein
MTPEVRKFLLQRLKFLRDELLANNLLANNLYEKRAGICYAINYNPLGTPLRKPAGTLTAIADLMTEWPKWSGERTFPVPHPEGKCPRRAYYNLPIWEGPYGALRRELLDYLIERLK